MTELTAHYLLLSGLIFSIGAFGVVYKRNAIVIFMCIELMLNSCNLALVAFGRGYELVDTHAYVFFVMAVAAAEAAVGLAIILLVYKNFRSIDTKNINTLRG